MDTYVEVRKKADDSAPPLKKTDDPRQIKEAQQALVERIGAARAGAKQGDIFTPEVTTVLKRVLRPESKEKDAKTIMKEEASTPIRALYAVPEAMALLNLSRTQIYELIRSRRLVTVTQGRRRLVPADSISEYVQLLLREAGGDDGRAA